MRAALLLASAVLAAPVLAQSAAESPSANAFAASIAPRMSVENESLAVYTEEEAARRCLAYTLGAVATETMNQETVYQDNASVELGEEQRTAFGECLLTEGYRIEWP